MRVICVLCFLSLLFVLGSAFAETKLIAIVNSEDVKIESNGEQFSLGDHLFLRSQNLEKKLIAVFVIVEKQDSINGHSYYLARLQRFLAKGLVMIGDSFELAELGQEIPNFKANTELLDHGDYQGFVSSRYRPLYTQGLGIGDTAETLKQDEFLLTWYGLLSYGAKDWLSISSILPLNAFGGPNLQLKFKFFQSNENILGAGISLWRVPGSSESAININFMWDSVSNSSLISHSFVTLAALTYDNSKDTTAIKSLGSSAIQSGYEFLLSDWSRILTGPNYNFETKSLGAYVSYLTIWEHFHFQVSLASNNLSSLRADVRDGYYGFFDAYWRY